MPSNPAKPWGPDNPHPLSQCKTEIVWEGKYDEYGERRPVALPSFPLVMQKVESIDAPRDLARAESDFTAIGHDERAPRDDFRNRLIMGDNKLALAALLQEFRGQVDLIYIDPPFDVGIDFTMSVPVGEEEVVRDRSPMEFVAYRDMWGRGPDSYLHTMCARLLLMRDMLSDEGVLYVHCDWRVNAALRLVLDEVFGGPLFRNEIVWHYANSGLKARSRKYHQVHDTILVYAKSPRFHFEAQREPFDDGGQKRQPRRKFNSTTKKADVVRDPQGKIIYDVREDKLVTSVWRIPMLNIGGERLDYANQKPEALLERAILTSAPPDALVLDCFCGSGTTLAVAERLGRRWIGCDLGRYAIHTTRKRLIGVQRALHEKGEPCRSFDVYNLGRCERQWWQMERLKGADEQHRETVLRFYRAAPLAQAPSPLLHGTKGQAYVHVAAIDSILTLDELRPVAESAAGAGAVEVHCLAWEFEMGLRKRAAALEAELEVGIRLKYIPREIMEPNRDQVQFFDAGAVEATAFVREEGKPAADKKRGAASPTPPHSHTPTLPPVDIRLTNFLPSLSEVPESELAALRERATRSPFDFIDFWAVDFEYREGKEVFEHHWQAYRTRKDRSLETESDCRYVYDTPGKKRICVKVIDVFGVDTTVVVDVAL